MLTCFSCGAVIQNSLVPCPKCGYKYTADDNRYCPNMHYGLCKITEMPCREGINYATCAIKNKVDRESII